MLTEVDIERIMAAKRQLAESVADDSDFELVDDAEFFELMDDDIPVTETNGLMWLYKNTTYTHSRKDAKPAKVLWSACRYTAPRKYR